MVEEYIPRFIVTRPGNEGTSLCNIIMENGYEAIHIPFYSITFNNLTHVNLHINSDDDLFFFSKNSVRGALHNWPNINRSCSVWAIGPGTCKELEDKGFTRVNVPQAVQEYNSEALLSYWDKLRNGGIIRRVILFQQKYGRKYIEQCLQNRNIETVSLPVYKQDNIDYKTNKITDFDCMILTSESALNGYIKHKHCLDNIDYFLVVGARLYELAKNNIKAKILKLSGANNMEIIKNIRHMIVNREIACG